MTVSLLLNQVGVEFPIYQGTRRSLRSLLSANASFGRLAADALNRISVVALQDISLDLRQGDRLAVIGKNGSGKSTLLKVLAGIHEPTTGTLTSHGRVTAILNAVGGLNIDATGRENIAMLGRYMNVPSRDMRAYEESIGEFTELGTYLDIPVRTYSAGMMVRLSFAASTAIPADILIMDEWLTAGDASFLVKAHQRLEQLASGAKLLVLASHSLPLLQEWCNRAILLERGQITAAGPVAEVCAAYEASLVNP